MPVIIKGGERLCLFGEHSSSCICLKEGKWNLKTGSPSPNVYVCTGEKYVSQSKDSKGVCVCVGAEKCVCDSRECAMNQGVCVCVDTSKIEPEAQGVVISVGERKWICQPREGPVPKVVFICIDTVKVSDTQKEEGAICISIGKECPTKCEAKDLKVKGVYCCTSEDWICKPMEGDPTQEICIYVDEAKCETMGIADSNCVLVCVATDNRVCGPQADSIEEGVCICIGADEVKTRAVCVCVGTEQCVCNFQGKSLAVCACIGQGKCVCGL